MEEESQTNDSMSGHQDLKTVFDEMLKEVEAPENPEVHEQCIYIVPPRIREAHPQAYTPKIISIGPFHNPHCRGPSCDPRAKEHTNILLSMEALKLKYLKAFLNRANLSEDLFSKIKVLENGIRSYYGARVIDNSNDFLKIIITDACFIIELFIRNFCLSWQYNGMRTPDWRILIDDPILSKPWLLSHIQADLILLENQLPFFVLQKIYEFAVQNLNPKPPSFLEISSYFFRQFNKNHIDIDTEGESPEHFTDLMRIFLKPSSFEFGQEVQDQCCLQCWPKNGQKNNSIDHVYSVSQLSEAGLVFEVIREPGPYIALAPNYSEMSKCLLDLRFDDKKGVLKMPCFHVHDTTEIHLRNILAFEECHFPPDSAYISQYLKILDFLINTEKDVSILIDKKIIVNWMGDANLVATMINNLSNNISMPDFNQKFDSICRSLNRFYENPCNKYKAIFKHEYFNTPWKIASTSAAMLLLLLTLIQTICSVWSLVDGKDKKKIG